MSPFIHDCVYYIFFWKSPPPPPGGGGGGGGQETGSISMLLAQCSSFTAMRRIDASPSRPHSSQVTGQEGLLCLSLYSCIASRQRFSLIPANSNRLLSVHVGRRHNHRLLVSTSPPPFQCRMPMSMKAGFPPDLQSHWIGPRHGADSCNEYLINGLGSVARKACTKILGAFHSSRPMHDRVTTAAPE